jgi:hypothetical protein
MSGPIHLYISSSAELVAEREAIGQIVAALPVTLGWEIDHTPLSGTPDALLSLAALEMRIQSFDLYAIVLGQDLTAPMGFEVRSALADGRGLTGARLVGAYRKECTRSPSAQDAVRTWELKWKQYADSAGFGKLFRRDLLRALLDVGPSLGLDLADIERLIKDQQAEGPEATGAEGDVGRGHAGRSGRILGREIWQVEEQG